MIILTQATLSHTASYFNDIFVFAGNNCESIDYCASQPCRNAATCISNLTSFKCNCVTGYTGPTCAFDVNECDLIPNLCKNGGTCQNIPGSYM